MKQLFLAILVLTSSHFSLSAASAGETPTVIDISGPSQDVMLRSSTRIEGDVIYLGDIFANTGDKSNIALAYTPKPGKRAIFDARWLVRVARAYKLDWHPLSNRDSIVIQRTSSLITQEQVAEQFREALADLGIDPDLDIQFSNRQFTMHVAGEGNGEVGFEDIAYDQRNQRFSAMVYAPAGDPSAPRTRITGRLYPTTEIPVASRHLLKGEIINKSDLRWLRVRSSRMQHDSVTNLDDLIGKSPKRGIREGQPIRASAVQNPILVEKGSLVTIILQAEQMFLTAQGKAMQPGSHGDTIRITNTKSNKSIEAEVIGVGRVAVHQTTLLALNQ
ncbi:MAG: flagellar basal body P-ring formation protein FlgA [Rhodospirillales bacterium]|nr:flagellar basal body P-ring formation protein FlgA [Rhodospirillales bacterium]